MFEGKMKMIHPTIRPRKYFILFVTPPKARAEIDEKGLTNVVHEGSIYNILGKSLKNYLRTDGLKGDLVRNKHQERLSFKFMLKLFIHALLSRNIFLFSCYSGTWFGQFGHFITETITRLDPDNQTSYRKYIFHSLDLDKSHYEIHDYQKQALKLLGIHFSKIKIMTQQPVVLLFSSALSPTVVLNSAVEPEAKKVWQKLSQTSVPTFSNDLIFISRSKLDKSRVKIPFSLNQRVEELFLTKGYKLINPELLEFNTQVALLSNATHVAGLMGSGLHLSVFAPETATIIEIGDCESPESGNPHQRELVSACNQKYFFINFLPHIEELDWNYLRTVLAK